MWTLILVSTFVDTILYRCLRLLAPPILYPTGSSITVELFFAIHIISLSLSSFLSLHVSQYRDQSQCSTLIVIPCPVTYLQLIIQTRLHYIYSIYIRHAGFVLSVGFSSSFFVPFWYNDQLAVRYSRRPSNIIVKWTLLLSRAHSILQKRLHSRDW